MAGKTTYGRLHPTTSGGMKIGGKTRRSAFSPESGQIVGQGKNGKNSK